MLTVKIKKRKSESKANEAHNECIDWCQSTGIFATLASPIDTSVIRRMEKTKILDESRFAHVYDKGDKKDRSPDIGKSNTPMCISDRTPVIGPSIIEIL